MIQHTVVFRLAHDAGSAEERDFLLHAATTLASIPGVGNFTVRRQVSSKSELTHQFSMEFADDDAYARYNEHPLHTGFIRERWQPEVVDFQEYDFLPL